MGKILGRDKAQQKRKYDSLIQAVKRIKLFFEKKELSWDYQIIENNEALTVWVC